MAQDGHPVHLLHFQIQDNHIGLFSAKELQALFSILREEHLIALVSENGVEEMSVAPIVINHENRHKDDLQTGDGVSCIMADATLREHLR